MDYTSKKTLDELAKVITQDKQGLEAMNDEELKKHFEPGKPMNVMTLKNGYLKPIFERIEDELISATEKFPSSRHNLAALTEEVGELAKALLDQFQEQCYDDGVSKEELARHNKIKNNAIFLEAVQVASAAIRVMTEGDNDFIYHPVIHASPLK